MPNLITVSFTLKSPNSLTYKKHILNSMVYQISPQILKLNDLMILMQFQCEDETLPYVQVGDELFD